MDFLEKKKTVYKSFNKLYKKFQYLDQEIGKQEKQYISTVPYHHVTKNNGIHTVNVVYDKPEYDPRIFIKLPGIILIYQYGEMFNEKNKQTEIFVYKDSDYTGNNPSSIKDILEKLEEYMENNQKMIYQKTNKKISNGYRDDAYTVKYKMVNFFDKKYIREMLILGLDINMDDIYKISTFKELWSFKTEKCTYKDDVFLRFLNVKHYFDYQSKFKSLSLFDYVNFAISLHESIFAKELAKNLKLNCKYLQMINLNLDYGKFFLLTDFHNVESININNNDRNYFLNSHEANLLSCFYKANYMNLNAHVKNFDFIYKLPYLEEFKGILKIIDEKDLESTKEKRQSYINKFLKEKPTFDVKGYLQYQRMLIELERKKLYTKLVIPRIAETKWRAIIEEAIANNDIEGVREKLLKIKQLPQDKREKIGTEDTVTFFDTNTTDSYKKLGIELALSDDECLLRNHSHATNIIGLYGNKLYKELNYCHYKKLPIIGPKGREIAIIEYQQDHYDIIEEQKINRIIENIPSNNNIFNFYYNSYLDTDEKLEYLEEKLNNFILLSCNKQVEFDIKKRNIQIKVKNIIQNKMNDIYLKNLFLSATTDNGKTLEEILLEKKSLDSIKEYLDENREMNRWNKEEVLLIEQQLLEYLKLNDKKERLLNIKSFALILDEFMENNESLKEVLHKIENINVESMFLNDVDELVNQFNLNETQKDFIRNYIFYLQESMQKEYEDYLKYLHEEEEALNTDGYGSILSWYSMFEKGEDTSLLKLYNEGTINHNEYIKASKYEIICEEISKIINTPKAIDIARINKYYELMDIIDSLPTSDLVKIKEEMTITNNYTDKFDKYCDHLIYTITGEYPEWILLELAKSPKLPKKVENVIHRDYVPKQKVFVKGYSKLITNPFQM